MTAMQSAGINTHVPDVASTSVCTYDEVPYPSYPVPASHPDRLFNVATLFGLTPVPPDHARILEIGCAGGGNLFPIASQFPQSKCVGVELSPVQVENAKIAIQFTGLKNIEINQGSVIDITSEFGTFDYILCHGVYSWVPDIVREAILRVSKQNLSENGVAFISYNTQPGWYLRGMVRDMLLRHVEEFANPLEKIEQAQALLAFLVTSSASNQTPYAAYVRAEAEFLSKQPDTYLFHEHLEDYNKAFFFQDFIRDTSRHGLQFLGESNPATMWLGNLPESTREQLESIQDVGKLGHYTDCIVGRTFRESLLVHEGLSISRNLDQKRLDRIRFLGRFAEIPNATSNSDSEDQGTKSFKAATGHVLTSCQNVAQYTIEALTTAYPQSLSLDQLIQAIEIKVKTANRPTMINRHEISATLMQWVLAGYIDFRFQEDRLSTSLTGKPSISLWARTQARAGELVTNLRHEMISMPEIHRQIMPFLDGSRDIDGIASEIDLLIQLRLISLETQGVKLDLSDKDLPLQVSRRILADFAKSSLILADA